MDATVCQAEITRIEIAAEAQASEITTLSSAEMSFVGGGLLAVDFS